MDILNPTWVISITLINYITFYLYLPFYKYLSPYIKARTYDYPKSIWVLNSTSVIIYFIMSIPLTYLACSMIL